MNDLAIKQQAAAAALREIRARAAQMTQMSYATGHIMAGVDGKPVYVTILIGPPIGGDAV